MHPHTHTQQCKQEWTLAHFKSDQKVLPIALDCGVRRAARNHDFTHKKRLLKKGDFFFLFFSLPGCVHLLFSQKVVFDRSLGFS